MRGNTSSLVVDQATAGTTVNSVFSDTKLAKRFRLGDQRAFTTIYMRYYKLVYAVCLGVVGSPQDAEDVTQETFAKAASSIDKFNSGNLKAWLVRIARNRSIDLVRSRRATLVNFEDENVPEMPAPVASEPDTAFALNVELSSVMAGLASLPELQRSTLLMREIGGQSFEEIGAVLDMSPDSIRDAVRRARMSLRNRREADNIACKEIRELLVSELDGGDGRTRSSKVRTHIKHCEDCKQFQAQVREEKRALRGLVPPLALGLLWRAGNKFALTSMKVSVQVPKAKKFTLLWQGVVGTAVFVATIGMLAGTTSQNPHLAGSVVQMSSNKALDVSHRDVPKGKRGEVKSAEPNTSSSRGDSEGEKTKLTVSSSSDSNPANGHTTREGDKSSKKSSGRSGSENTVELTSPTQRSVDVSEQTSSPGSGGSSGGGGQSGETGSQNESGGDSAGSTETTSDSETSSPSKKLPTRPRVPRDTPTEDTPAEECYMSSAGPICGSGSSSGGESDTSDESSGRPSSSSSSSSR